jgi:hypothetical protein
MTPKRDLAPRRVREKCLEQLGVAPAVVPSHGSYLASEMSRLRTVPLNELSVEDLRILIGQSVGLQFLVPIAVEHLEAEPLASGDFYRGDLLRNVTEVPDTFWSSQAVLRRRLVRVLQRALDQIRTIHAVEGLERELRAALDRHQAP